MLVDVEQWTWFAAYCMINIFRDRKSITVQYANFIKEIWTQAWWGKEIDKINPITEKILSFELQ